MKYAHFLFVLLLATVVSLTACNGNTKKTGPAGGNPPAANGGGTTTAPTDIKLIPGQNTPLQFSHFDMNFGPVPSGDTVRASYPFKNVTNTPIKISQVAVSCACMMTDYPKGLIQPGEIGAININFATAGQFGRHEKIIAVVIEGSNEPISLHLNGEIEKAPQ
jgi:hypothetical protein